MKRIAWLVALGILSSASLPRMIEARKDIVYKDPAGWRCIYNGTINRDHPMVQELKMVAKDIEEFKIVARCAFDEDHDYAGVLFDPGELQLFWASKTKVVLTLKDGSRRESLYPLFTSSPEQWEYWGLADCHGKQMIDDSLCKRKKGYEVFVVFPRGIRGVIAVEVVDIGVKPSAGG